MSDQFQEFFLNDNINLYNKHKNRKYAYQNCQKLNKKKSDLIRLNEIKSAQINKLGNNQ